jgi:hypothetical protein
MRQVVFVATTLFLLACGPSPNAHLPGETVTPSLGGSSGAAGTITSNGGVVGSGGSINPFAGGTTGSNGGIVSSGGVVSSGGTTSAPFGDGGAASGGGVASSGGDTSTGGAIGTDDGGDGSEPCVPAKTITGSGSGNSGSFGTTGAFCFKTADSIAGWNCSNYTGRTLKVNGTTETCGTLPLPAKVNGYYYFDSSAGSLDYASIYWY